LIRFKHETLLLLTALGIMLLLTPSGLYPSTTPGGLIKPVFAYSNGQYASLEIGQTPASFTTGTTSTFNGPKGLRFDSAGDLWVFDAFNGRVLEFTPPFKNGMTYTLDVGDSCSTSALNVSPLGLNVGIAFDASKNLWVADGIHRRVLEFNYPFTANECPSVVLGGPSTIVFSAPKGLVFDGAGDLWVSDGSNGVLDYCQVLEFPPTLLTSTHLNPTPSITLGFHASCTPPYARNKFDNPEGLAFDGSGNLWVADDRHVTAGGRVLEFKPPFSSHMNAYAVIGQLHFLISTCYSSSPPLSATGICGPNDVTVDGSGNVWIADADSANNRVLEFNPPFNVPPFSVSNPQPAASLVIGEPDFTTNNHGTAQNLLDGSTGLRIVFDSVGNLWVSDTANNRVLEFFVNEVAADSSTVTLSGSGGGSFASSLTGITVTVSGSTGGASVFIVPEVLSSQSSGVGTLSLSNGKFFDVAISGVTAGTATVCVPDASADSITVLQYWSGSAWVTASGITVTGTTVCGNIPVSALQGTNLGAGDQIPTKATAFPAVHQTPVGGTLLPSVGLTVLVPWAIVLSLLGGLSVEAFRIKRREKRR